ncbi:hypothetical protein NDK47_14755 [Brevibacillus ruminantium]|uniref:GNAT family N-acetyltransferase n=1 Tax=Brevibacillus ruminantium TaxID=2950604 RepID=A0ABY4W8R1_9BACL|nr:hypothetical protein [Brevibacillus ruminantium]USG63438.1 hypothetical protein NDK47_14755 [Brevibacillus ruminantium]
MNYEVKLLGEEDNDALLELAATSDTGNDLFRVDRSPDFFALGKSWGESTYYGLWRKKRLIGCLGTTQMFRFIHGEKVPSIYLHDFRLHPQFTHTRAYYRLVSEVVDQLKQKQEWVYGIVWDSNQHQSSLVRGERLFPEAVSAGQTVHLGMPLFMPLSGDWKSVEEILPEDAWLYYQNWAVHRDFAYADRDRYLDQSGPFLGFRRGGQIEAVTKVVDQTAVRKLIVSRSLPFPLRVLHAPFRLRQAARLPETGEEFHHVYLAHYASVNQKDRRPAFFAYLSRRYHQQYSYGFAGLSQQEAAPYRHPLAIKLGSSTYVYGSVPRGLTLLAHELTLM